jgi:hypothetical protein
VHVQVLIRWALQRGTSCLPKSANPERIASNFDVLDWQLTPEDQQALDTLLYRVSTVDATRTDLYGCICDVLTHGDIQREHIDYGDLVAIAYCRIACAGA